MNIKSFDIQHGEYLTPAQVAKRLGVEAHLVRGWCASGKIRNTNFGSIDQPRYKISTKTLAAWLAERTSGGD